jgi:hypothetical protein
MPTYGCSDLSRLATFDLASPDINLFFCPWFPPGETAPSDLDAAPWCGARRPGGLGAIRTAKGRPEREKGTVSRVQFDRSQKTPSRELIQPGRSNVCHQIRKRWRWLAAPETGIYASPTYPRSLITPADSHTFAYRTT